MSLSPSAVLHILLALTVLLVTAHLGAALFTRIRQPPVIGEILGGLVLGPTVLGLLFPSLKATMFPETGPTAIALGVIGHLGLLFLMFITGTQVSHSTTSHSKAVWFITLTGLIVPFATGFGLAALVDHSRYSGDRGSPTMFALVFGIAAAVTSVPVIARIMTDLNILHTAFARVVLSVAVIEDVALYMTLAVVLGMANASSGSVGLLPESLATSWAPAVPAYHLVVTFTFFAVLMISGPRLYAWLRTRQPVRGVPSSVALHIAFLLGLSCLSAALGMDPIFGALLAGLSIGRGEQREHPDPDAEETGVRQPNRGLTNFAMAFFIPVYFATVGLKLDLIRQFDPFFFIWFLFAACAVKLISVVVGARLAGEPPRQALDLAVAMNARGGPGIIIATITLTAGVINERFFTALVLLSILTSQIAGIWLERSLRRDPLRFETPRAPSGPHAARVTQDAGPDRGSTSYQQEGTS